MVVAMFLGMAVLGVPAGWAMGPLGTNWSELHANAPAVMLFGMAGAMTAPMVAWMRYRGLAAMLLRTAEYTHGVHAPEEAIA